MIFSIPATVICNSPSETALRIQREGARGNRNQIVLLNTRLHDLDMAANA